MNSVKITRNSKRSKNWSQNLKVVDNETRQYVIQSKIDALESDYYESPNRLAEDKSDEEYVFEEGDGTQETDKKRPNRRLKKRVIKKRVRNDIHFRKNLNLKKLIKEEGLENKDNKFLNYLSIKVEPPNQPSRKFCSICNAFSKYTCPRCGEKYCSLRCQEIHTEVMCIKFDN